MANRLLTTAIALAMLPAMSAPAFAQSRADQARWDAAQQRYQAETDLFQRERARYYARGGRGYQGGAYQGGAYQGGAYQGGYQGTYPQGGGYGYAPPQPGTDGYGDDQFATDYDASRYYRDDSRYQERRLSSNDQVYRGSDGRYYCKRNDGTTGLILGAAGGGVLGNVIDGGRHRAAGTLIGGALGALLGRSVEQNSDIRCR